MLTSALIALVAPAHACGGFFCNNEPVDQSGEDIVFAVDEEKGETTVHVQISYQGSAEEFAWIVPVPQVPEIVLSTDRLFQELSWRTRPQFVVETVERGLCNRDYYGTAEDMAFSASSASSSPAPPSAGGGVDVVSEQRVGPYDTVVLQADSAELLLDWLQANGYQLPDSLDPVLAPYVAGESYFVALKMAKDSDVGQLAPLAMRYAGTGASVPIQLTSIAATEDMRLHVYVLGEHRAVPDSYYHVQVNDLVVDWFQPWDPKWEEAITIAADEAGGHAFATDYSGSTSVMDDALYRDGQFDIDALAAAPDAYAFFDELLSQGFVGDTTMLALFREFLPIPAGAAVDEQSFYNCLECYPEIVDAIPFDAAAFAAAIDERVVTPAANAQSMLDALPHLTRLTSSVSPVEMTVDPTFVFNADMAQDIALQRNAKVEMLCGVGGGWTTSPRRLVLSDGRAYELPSIEWFWNAGITEYDYLSKLMTVYALVVEDTGPDGEPTVIFDYTDQAFADADAFNADPEAAGGCGCNAGGSVGTAAGLLLLGAFARRRRS